MHRLLWCGLVAVVVALAWPATTWATVCEPIISPPLWDAPLEFEADCGGPLALDIERIWPSIDKVHPPGGRLWFFVSSHLPQRFWAGLRSANDPDAEPETLTFQRHERPGLAPGFVYEVILPTPADDGGYMLDYRLSPHGRAAPVVESQRTLSIRADAATGQSVGTPSVPLAWFREVHSEQVMRGEHVCHSYNERVALRVDGLADVASLESVVALEVEARAVAPHMVAGWTLGADARHTYQSFLVHRGDPTLGADLIVDLVQAQAEFYLRAHAHCIRASAVGGDGSRHVMLDSCSATRCVENRDVSSEEWDTIERGGCPYFEPYVNTLTPGEEGCWPRDPEDDYWPPEDNWEDPYNPDGPYPIDGEGITPADQDPQDFERREGNWGGCACRSLPLSPGQHGPLWMLAALVFGIALGRYRTRS